MLVILHNEKFLFLSHNLVAGFFVHFSLFLCSQCFLKIKIFVIPQKFIHFVRSYGFYYTPGRNSQSLTAREQFITRLSNDRHSFLARTPLSTRWKFARLVEAASCTMRAFYCPLSLFFREFIASGTSRAFAKKRAK